MTIPRPNVFQWLWFAFGGRLPMRYREWVLQDAVSRTWLLRFTARALVRIAPLVVATLIVLWLVDAAFGLGVDQAMTSGRGHAGRQRRITSSRSAWMGRDDVEVAGGEPRSKSSPIPCPYSCSNRA
jgi:Family of unknown function (DUF5313)